MKTRTFIVGGLAVQARTTITARLLIYWRACLWTGFLALAMIPFGPRPTQAAVTEAWVQRYGSEAGSEDRVYKVVTDAAGNVIVAGSTAYQTWLVIKYSGAGVPLWTNRGPDEAAAVAVDGSGNVFVTGYSYDGSGANPHYATIAYSGAGVPLWTNRYNGPGNGGDYPNAVVVDASGNVFVAGSSDGGGFNYDYATIAYSGAGVPLWTNRYNGPGNGGDQPSALAVDGSGNVFVTGSSIGNGGIYDDYATIAYSGAGVPLWTNRYNGPGNGWDYASALAVDGSGNVFVTGSSGGSGGSPHYATIAYSGTGVRLWINRYNGSGIGYDEAKAVAVDGSGNVFVTGYSYRYDGSEFDYVYATIAYSGAGVPLWTNYYNGPANGSDRATAVAVDGSGNVFVTGNSAGSGGNSDYVTIAYSSAGIALWTNRYNGPENGGDYANAVAVDGSGNVFVTGNSGESGGDTDYGTIAYSGAGVTLWTNRYGGRADASNIASAVAVDGSGNVFVTGYSYGTPGYEDYSTIAYSGAGVSLWTNRYNGPYNGSDEARAVAVDGSGNVFVTGSSVGSRGEYDHDYATIAYSGAGVPLWTNRYDGPYNGNDEARAVAVDGSGKVFVTGSSLGSGGNYDYATIAYSGAGVPLWTNRYNGPENAGDSANAVAVDGSGNVFVTGYSGYSCNEECFGGDYATIAYSGAGVPLWTNRYDGPYNRRDNANAVAVDRNGKVFVTGSSFSYGSGFDSDYVTIAYSGAGVALWTNRYKGLENGYNTAHALAVDASGNVFVTGSSTGSEGIYDDYTTIAYSGAGVPLWTNRYNVPGNGGGQPSALAVDANGNVFVTGTSYGGGIYDDYATIAYSGAGVPLWTNRYNGPGNGDDRPQTKSSLAIGSDGAVYVTGTSDGLFSSDFATVKYVWRTEIAIHLLSTISPNVNLTLSGAPNSSWAIERALEPIGPWTNLTALLIGTNGFTQFQDYKAPSPAGFYRAVQQ